MCSCNRHGRKVALQTDSSQEKEKKQKHLGECLENRRHFTPFMLSVDGLLGQEAKTFTKRLAVKLVAGKWQKPCSQVRGCVKARLSTAAAVRATHLCLRRSRVPVHNISTGFSQWEDGAGLAMLHEWT
jgi:predicted alpha/beta-fold hydrolase